MRGAILSLVLLSACLGECGAVGGGRIGNGAIGGGSIGSASVGGGQPSMVEPPPPQHLWTWDASTPNRGDDTGTEANAHVNDIATGAGVSLVSGAAGLFAPTVAEDTTPPSTLNINSGTSFTWSTWFSVDDWYTDGFGDLHAVLMGKYWYNPFGPPSGVEFQMLRVNRNSGTDGTIAWYRRDASTQSQIIGTAGAISLDTRYHVLGTVDHTISEMRLYLDGELVGTTTYTAEPSYLDTAAEWTIGTLWDPFNAAHKWRLQGDLDETAVWTSALDAGEVASVYEWGLAGISLSDVVP